MLVKKQLAVARNWRWTLLEWVFPLQGILFLWLMFNLGNLVLPFEKVETAAQSFAPENLVPSLPGLLGLMHIGGTVAIAAPDDGAAARRCTLCSAARTPRCTPRASTRRRYGASRRLCRRAAMGRAPATRTGDVDGMLDGMTLGQLGDTTPGDCLYLDDAAAMTARGGWLPFINTGAAGSPPAGLYLGVEIGAHSMSIRHEEMLLAENANADPHEKNAARSVCSPCRPPSADCCFCTTCARRR